MTSLKSWVQNGVVLASTLGLAPLLGCANATIDDLGDLSFIDAGRPDATRVEAGVEASVDPPDVDVPVDVPIVPDAGEDAGRDAPFDGRPDGADGALDAPLDTRPDISDAPLDTKRDAPVDARPDVVDAKPDVRDSGCPGLPVGQECQLAPQCGCAANQTCQLLVGLPRCIAAGTTAIGQSCDATNDCVAGATCVGGMCRTFCSGLNDTSCSGGEPCMDVVDRDGNPVAGFFVCGLKCQLDKADSCGATTAGQPPAACVFDEVNGTQVSDCVSPASLSTTNCELSNPDVATACAAGYTCIDLGSSLSTCAKWCRMGATGACSGGLSCTGFQTPVVVDGVTYGVCF